MPALVKSRVGSSPGTSGELCTTRWPFLLKYSRKEARISFAVIRLFYRTLRTRGGRSRRPEVDARRGHANRRRRAAIDDDGHRRLSLVEWVCFLDDDQCRSVAAGGAVDDVA